MSNITRMTTAIVTGLVLLIIGQVETAEAQSAVPSLEFRGGYVFLKDSKRGTALSADIGLGSLGTDVIRPFAGAKYWHTRRMGYIKSYGARLGLRFDLPPGARFAPYAITTLNAHNVDADIGDPALEDRYEGFYVGGGVGAGLSLAFDELRQVRLVVEGERVFIKNLSHWGVSAGFRITPKGEPTILAAKAAAEDARLAAERQRLAAEQARQERERAERERAERERLEAERLAAERAKAEQEAAAERARAEADEARRRADEAEARAYDALVELDRMISNIAGIRETDRGLTVVLGHGLFGVGQHSLSAQARSEVDRIAAVLKQYPNNQIAVEGHTDSTGSVATNERLSLQRAQAVRDALIANDISSSRIEVGGFASTRPIADNGTAAGRAQNRRVEIVIIGARRPVTTND